MATFSQDDWVTIAHLLRSPSHPNPNWAVVSTAAPATLFFVWAEPGLAAAAVAASQLSTALAEGAREVAAGFFPTGLGGAPRGLHSFRRPRCCVRGGGAEGCFEAAQGEGRDTSPVQEAEEVDASVHWMATSAAFVSCFNSMVPLDM